MLCKHVVSESALGTIQGVQRIEIPEGATFIVLCRRCEDTLRVDVPLDERPAGQYQAFEEFWAWLTSVHAPREREKAADIEELLIAQTPSEVCVVLRQTPETAAPSIVESHPLLLSEKLAA